MKARQFLQKSKPITTFDDLYKDIQHDWQHKAARLRARRWRAMRRTIKRSPTQGHMIA